MDTGAVNTLSALWEAAAGREKVALGCSTDIAAKVKGFSDGLEVLIGHENDGLVAFVEVLF